MAVSMPLDHHHPFPESSSLRLVTPAHACHGGETPCGRFTPQEHKGKGAQTGPNISDPSPCCLSPGWAIDLTGLHLALPHLVCWPARPSATREGVVVGMHVVPCIRKRIDNHKCNMVWQRTIAGMRRLAARRPALSRCSGVQASLKLGSVGLLGLSCELAISMHYGAVLQMLSGRGNA